jgi:hypothetical protein
MDAATADAATDAAAGNPDSGSMMTENPPTDGSQLTPCTFGEQDACADGLGCYQRGATSGFCTATCEDDEDCAALSGADYTCSTTFGGGGQGPGGGMGLCRIDCEGADDTESCPAPLKCLSVGGGFGGNGNGNGNGQGGAFRCGYAQDQAPQGADDVPLWGRCEDSGDCVGDLVCYGVFQQGAAGFCTHTCENTDDCTDAPASGDIEPTCGTQNQCRFDCTEGGTCPDGLECIQDRCVYGD